MNDECKDKDETNGSRDLKTVRGSRIPSIYRNATLRVVTPVENGRVGFGFNLPDGEVLRLNIPKEDAVTIGQLMLTTTEQRSEACRTKIGGLH
tara:strand:+ start:3503 stop:3781 length:279 start_codon:yes stop_codon:yes gene_type:complete